MAAVEEQKQGKQAVRQGQGPLDLKVFLDGLLTDSRITQADCDNAITVSYTHLTLPTIYSV